MVDIVKPSVELLFVTPDAEKLIELAGRTCYRSEEKITPGSAERFVTMLMAKHHESVIEHAVATLKFVCDRGLSHELVRHRLASFSQESSRYCNYGKTGGIQVIPMLDGLTKEQWIRRQNLLAHIEQVYLNEIAEGIKPQQARDVLPTCLKTVIVVTANFREWRTIFRLRLNKAAHPQMRSLMQTAFEILHAVAPTVFPTEEFLTEE